MKRFSLSIAVLFGLMLSSLPAYAALSVVGDSPGVDDVREINNMTPGSSKTFLGTRLRGNLTTGATTYASGENLTTIANCTGSGATAGSFATPTTTAFLKTTGAATGETYCLGDGVYNQRLTVVLMTDGGKDFVITPKTKSGFTNATVNDAKDTVTLRYINDTAGWTIEGNNGATIN